MKEGIVSLSARDEADATDRDPPDRAATGTRDPSFPPPAEADRGGLQALDRDAAAGGMPPERIRRILADLAPALAELHRARRVHGDISPSTIGLDASGHARLLSPPLTPAANAEHAPRRDGYAAFEQYTDDPDTPCGPWTDIYALAATACALLTGLAPPPALARCVRDDYIPLTRRRGPEERAFCEALDRALAVEAYARPQSMDEFARTLGVDSMAREATQQGPGHSTAASVSASAPDSGSAPASASGPASASPLASASTPASTSEAAFTSAAGSASAPPFTSPSTSASAATPPSSSPSAATPASTSPHASIPPSDTAFASASGAAAAAAAAGLDAGRDNLAAEKDARERLHTLEDSDGLESTSAWASARAALGAAGAAPHGAHDAPMRAAAGASSAEPFHAGLDAPSGTAAGAPDIDDPARNASPAQEETDAADTPIAVATVNAWSKPKPRHAGAPMPRRRRRASRRRVPLLTMLAIVAILGAALYAWLRPQAPRRAPVIARTADSASRSASSSAASAGQAEPRPSGQASQGAAAPASAAIAPPPIAGAAPVASSDAGLRDPTTAHGDEAPASTASTVAGIHDANPSAPPETQGSANMAGHGASAIGNTATPPADTKAATAQDAAKKPPAPAAGKAPVTVPVAIRPWGEVLVNGRSRGVSPPLRSLSLAPGKYEITVRNNAGPDYRQTLNVTAGGSAVISHTFQ